MYSLQCSDTVCKVMEMVSSLPEKNLLQPSSEVQRFSSDDLDQPDVHFCKWLVSSWQTSADSPGWNGAVLWHKYCHSILMCIKTMAVADREKVRTVITHNSPDNQISFGGARLTWNDSGKESETKPSMHFAQPLSKSSLVYPLIWNLHFILHIFLHSIIVFFLQHTPKPLQPVLL